jgi:ABC-2 type transport system ATP-binding protein
MRRLVNIGAAMMHGPRLLVLDEPTVGVDNRTRDHLREVMRSLRDRGLAVLLTTHDMEEAEALADRISIIVGGEIKAEGPPHQIVQSAFGSKQEVRVVLDASRQTAKQFDAHRARLAKFGLAPSQENSVWEGLVGEEDGQLPKLASQLSASKSGVVEVRIRQPGLRSLLAWYVT